MLTFFSTLLYSGALSFGNVNIYILLFNGAKSSSGTIENQTETETYTETSGRSKGGHEGRAPPGGPNSFNFMQFWGKYGKIVCWCPPGELAPPPRGNPGSTTGNSQLTQMHICRLFTPRNMTLKMVWILDRLLALKASARCSLTFEHCCR